jgi:hypothetical protein
MNARDIINSQNSEEMSRLLALGDNFPIHNYVLRNYFTASYWLPFYRVSIIEWPRRHDNKEDERCSA